MAYKTLNDCFTVSKETGNGALKCPVNWQLVKNLLCGMIPYAYAANDAFSYVGVRPSVSLRPGIEYLSGDGSGTLPYIIDIDNKL